ncbi:MAG TPA: dihydrolipoyl dehydrogenase [Chloroflexi bacterium]|nr:dihydrolipoyl dehydrogenase [Chloroflexota bacterium]
MPKQFDLIVIGSGAGMNVAARAAGHGMQVAIVDNGPLGGTCLNRGCIPSKVMLYPADVIRTIQEAHAVGVHATVEAVDFEKIMARVWEIVLDGRREMAYGVAQTEDVTFFNADGAFVDAHTLQVGDERIEADTIVIAAGARPLIPPIEGLEAIGYLNSATVFDLETPPESLIIVGGGYIAAEFAHFFSAIGVQVTVVGRNPRLVPEEEPEISEVLQRKMAEYCQVYTGYEAVRAERAGDLKAITAIKRTGDAEQDAESHPSNTKTFTAQEVLIATGRRSNADILQPERAGIETIRGGWIKTDPYLQTSQENVWALGDARGRYMFRHTANYEAEMVWTNAFTEHRHAVDEHAVPHAVFTHPQIGSVGLTEAQAQTQAQAQAGHGVLVGIKRYYDTAKGFAMAEETGFVKVVVENETGRILGAHVIGPHAAILVQQIVYVMNSQEGNYLPLARAQTIHPALSEVVIGALGNLRPAGEHAGHHHHHHQDAHGHQDNE